MTLQRSPYLKTQWQFPYDDLRSLSHQVDISYIDIAQKVNSRTIGQYPTGFNVATGDRWFLGGSNSSQQTLRQVYQFTATGNISHGLTWSSVAAITPLSYGSYTDGTSWFGVLYASSTAIAGQVSFYVNSTNIVVVAGAGAPAISSGIIVLEWISQV